VNRIMANRPTSAGPASRRDRAADVRPAEYRRAGAAPLLLLALTAATSVLLGACQAAEIVTGPATVIDGDSLKIGETTIRLHAVDAFEGRQTCLRRGERWPCGEAAANRMRELVAGRTITCEPRDLDDYGRTVAVCSSGRIDLGAELVRDGLALAYRRYGNDYVDEEDEARSARRGVWAGEFTPPWEWRRNPEPAAAPRAPPPTPDRSAQAERRAGGAADSGSGASGRTGSCRIKGNISDRGRIYHVPGSRSYEQTVIDESRGERWFCSEQEAIAAGWRAPR